VWNYDIKIIIYPKERKQTKLIFSLVEYTLHILETNDKLQNVGFKSYLHLEKSIWNLFLQCKILKWIHNSEKIILFLSFKLKDWMYNDFVICFCFTPC
jgi:hypothetical protein